MCGRFVCVKHLFRDANATTFSARIKRLLRDKIDRATKSAQTHMFNDLCLVCVYSNVRHVFTHMLQKLMGTNSLIDKKPIMHNKH